MFEAGAQIQSFIRTDIGAFITLAIVTILFISVTGFFFKKSNFNTRALIYVSMTMAIAFVLSYFRLFQMPMGGSVTFMSMFFVSLIGMWFGPAIGIIGGVSYGFLQLAQNPQVIHPMQLFLDYPLAFGMLGLSGFFYKVKFGVYIGFLVGATGRWFMHTLAGYFFWTQMWPPEGWDNVFLFSVVYNAGYIYAEVALTLVIVLIPAVSHGLEKVKNIAVNYAT